MAVDLGPDGLTLGSTTINDWADVGGGKVLQVVQGTRTDVVSLNNTDTWIDTGVDVTITPSSTSSKILINAMVSFGKGADVAFRLYRNTSPIFLSDSNGSRLRASFGSQGRDSFELRTSGMIYLDSPATTSATEYSVYAYLRSDAPMYLNSDPQYGSENNANCALGVSNIIVQEIAG